VSFRRIIFPKKIYNRMNIFRKPCHLLTIFLPKRNDWFKPGTVELTCHSSIKWTILRMWDQMKTTFSIYKGSLPYGKFKCSNQATVENSHFTLTIGEHSSKCETRLELIVPYSLPYIGSLKIGDQRKICYIRVILKVRRSGGENGQFRHNRASNA
jgi:hypothetical protein